MTAKQRAVLAAIGTWTSAAEIANSTGNTFLETLRLLRLLEDREYVVRRNRSEFVVTPKGVPFRERGRLERTQPTKRPRRFSSTSFSKKYADPKGSRYGGLFLVVRVLRCWLDGAGYFGPGHRECGLGVQGGHTAHHVGRLDEEGLIPGCGRAHDLYARLGGIETVEAFDAWLEETGYGIEETALIYVVRAKKVTEDRSYEHEDLAW